MHHEGDLVDGRCVDALDNGVGGHVAELCHFAAHGGGDVVFGAEHQHVGLDTHLLQLLHGMLGRFGFQLFGGAYVGDISEVDADYVVAHFPFQLAHGLEVRGGLDVAHGASYLGNHEVIVAGVAQQFDVAFDFVCDVGYNLHRLAQVIAAAFLVDDALVDAAGGDIVGARGADVGETFVVAQVEVGLVAVYRHIALAVLVRVEGARVDVDIGVEFLDGDTVAAREKQAGQR